MTRTRSSHARRIHRTAVAIGVVLVAATAPADAGPLPSEPDVSSTTVTTTPIPTTSTSTTTAGPASTASTDPSSPTTAPAVPWPEPVDARCSPNWFSGFLMGVETEHGSRPAAIDQTGLSATDVGASLAFDTVLVRDGGETDFSVTEHRISITADGRTHHLTTAPHPAYGHYPSRTPGPFEVGGGTLRFVSDAGRTWVLFAQSTSGAWGTFGWELGSCTPVSDPAVREAPRGTAVPGRPGYTG